MNNKYNRDNVDNTQRSPLRWMSIEELDALCDWQPAPELTEALRKVREQIAEEASSEQANQERFRDAQAVANFLQQPVIYSQY
jgi:hypothetical protein